MTAVNSSLESPVERFATVACAQPTNYTGTTITQQPPQDICATMLPAGFNFRGSEIRSKLYSKHWTRVLFD
jgi:hypothetical protein